jgi:hypothetical protein
MERLSSLTSSKTYKNKRLHAQYLSTGPSPAIRH